MKFEIKVIILSCLLSIGFMFIFTYVSTIGQKTYYAYQVGIYKEEKNKNNKLDELENDGYKGYSYQKDHQYYVLSMISENYDDIQKHSQNVKGIIKKYVVSNDTTIELLLENLAKEEVND